jgi:predicted membrane chloride channel (bestrophin family)
MDTFFTIVAIGIAAIALIVAVGSFFVARGAASASTKHQEEIERKPLLAEHAKLREDYGELQKNFDVEQGEEGYTHLYSYQKRSQDIGGAMKMLRYDYSLTTGWTALFHISGTAFGHRKLWWTCSVYWITTAVLAFTLFAMRVHRAKAITHFELDSDTNLSHLATVTNYITALLGFMVGLFVTSIINRWWRMREGCVGGFFRATMAILNWLSIRMPEASEAKYKETVLRLALLSHRLVYCSARNRESDADMMHLCSVGLMTAEEKEAVAGQPAKASLIWVWIGRYIRGIAEQAKWFNLKESRALEVYYSMAQGAIVEIDAYCGTQLPFQYVHLLSMSVLMSNLLIAVKCGVAIGKAISPDTPTDNVYVFVQIFHVLFVPFSYHAFLLLCEELSNPFGDDFCDFPGYYFHCKLRDDCMSLHHAGENCPATLLNESKAKSGEQAKEKAGKA